jgi:hypothetical protein
LRCGSIFKNKHLYGAVKIRSEAKIFKEAPRLRMPLKYNVIKGWGTGGGPGIHNL